MNLQPNGQASAHDTSLVGYIQATARQLEQAFGKPEVFHPSEKVPVRWTLVDSDTDGQRAIATIYLWNRSVPDSDDVISWHVGGLKFNALVHVHNAFRSAHSLMARSA
jgi:hypothetical protein